MASISEQQPKLHIFFFPLIAHGHMLPMFDIARLFACRGAKSTFITTPPNAPLFSDKIHRDRSLLGLDIQIQTIHFPYAQVGLPESFSSSKSITSPEMADKFVKAFSLFGRELEQLLQQHRPHCLVADMFFPWATDLAAKFGIPRLVFHGTAYFALCVEHSLTAYKPQNKVPSEEAFVVPGLPDRIELTRGVLGDDPEEFWDEIKDSEMKSFGVLVNSFYGLEPDYAHHYNQKLGRKAWEIGPVSLCNRSAIDKGQRGEKARIEQHHCLMSWLDKQKPNSVLYISFGSESHFSRAQLGEIAMGLEASRVPFIWVVRTSTTSSSDDANIVDDFLPNGFKERIEGKQGLIILDWAPQVLILDHEAVGGFLTHCGWNSVMESVCAGVPMITWPLYAEQFYNEKFVNEVLRIGVGVGNVDWCSWTEEINTSVKRDKVERAVVRLMGGGDDVERMRARTKELGEMARRAVEEGGSSYLQMTALIEELRGFNNNREKVN